MRSGGAVPGRRRSGGLLRRSHSGTEQRRESEKATSHADPDAGAYGVAEEAGRFHMSLVVTASGKLPSGFTLALATVLPAGT